MSIGSRTPAVSVVLPFRDRVEWTLEAVESVRGQTFQDVEIVLVDDGSSEEIPASLRRNDKVRYIRLSGAGRSRARNTGAAAARAPFVAFLDSDDLFAPEKLERQLSAMEARPDVGVSHTSYERIDESGASVGFQPAGRCTGRVFPAIITNCPVAVSTVVARAAALGPQPFTPGLDIGEDLLLWVRLAREGDFLGIDEPLTKIRVQSGTTAFSANAVATARRQLLPFLEPRYQRRLRASMLVAAAHEGWRTGAPKATVVTALARAALLRPNPLAAARALARSLRV